MTLIRRLSIAAAVATLIQIGSGGLVRATGSGEGCPDWPRCFGRWFPPIEYHALIEYTHRFIALIAIGLVLATAVVALARHRREPALLWPATLGAVTIIGLAGVGAAVVRSGLSETLVTVHIGIAMGLVAGVVYTAVNASCIDRFLQGKVKEPVERRTARLAVAAALGILAAILLGADVRGSGAGLAFRDWPLMDGSIVPAMDGLEVRQFAHRAGVLLAGLVLAWFVARAHRARPRDAAVVIFARIAGGLFLVQALVGAAQVWTRLEAWAVALHVWLSALVWASLVAAFAVTRRLAACAVPDRPARARREPAPISGGQVDADVAFAPPVVLRRGAWDVVRAYVALTKPRIIELLVVTTIPTMMVAAGGLPDAWLTLATVVGGSIGAGAANTINMYFDRDIDAVMRRTRARPLPAHAVTPARALTFGLVLAVVSFAFMVAAVNLVAALLVQAAIAFYVLVYTLVLKRSTPQNIVIGGAAGAVPTLVGWAAVTGSVGIEAWVLFAVVFLWTPPHFWALAMRHAKEYAAAGIPMLPVVAGSTATRRQILVYAVATVAASLVLVPVASMGPLYTVAALAAGGWFVLTAERLRRSGEGRDAMGLFRSSITYLTLVFVAAGADALARAL